MIRHCRRRGRCRFAAGSAGAQRPVRLAVRKPRRRGGSGGGGCSTGVGALPLLEDRSAFRSWLFRILNNVFIRAGQARSDP
jgi:hypothetical protein